ncbi:galactokinase [Pseudaquabacterium rugosum]|uniref:Galactokinase n=1 Tax=Pseudaquabacterium rugosum TaxID=2984194 RepID=A0ABU9BKA4_9BURK
MSLDPLRQRAATAFDHAFGGAPTAWVRAPGRVNLIGEHTDYNAGFVLPCAIDYQTVIGLRPRADRAVHVVAADHGAATDTFDLDAPITRRHDPLWADYVRGMVKMLREDDHALAGVDLVLAGDVPQGAGLSSSASLQVALGQAFRARCDLDGLSPTRIAQLAQRAENRFIDVACGIMDQLISARGQRGHALLIDCRSLEAEPVPLPAGMAVMIIHSRVRRGLVDSAYNERRQQCEAAARHYGVPALRDIDEATLHQHRAGLDPLVWRRARHIVTENARTLQAAEALRAGDLARLGTLMAASHASMRDDFEITHPAVDALVEVTRAAIERDGGQGGTRMTGGGFGGCVVALLPRERVDAVRAAIADGYRAPTGEPATVWVSGAADGASTFEG